MSSDQNIYTQVYKGEGNFNFLFYPGGPGVHSSYFLPLIQSIEWPGNVYLVDFPGCGAHPDHGHHFDTWKECLLTCLKKFEHIVYVGHSFSGMFPLQFPEVEPLIEAMILIGAAPCSPVEASNELLKEKGIEVDPKFAEAFRNNPSIDTFRSSLIANTPKHFAPPFHAIGKTFFATINFNIQGPIWWFQQAAESKYEAKWVPQDIPTLLLAGDHDYICPSSMFRDRPAFHRKNITIQDIPDAGHFPWICHPKEVRECLQNFIYKL